MYLLTYYFHIMFTEIKGNYILYGKYKCLLDSRGLAEGKEKKTKGKEEEKEQRKYKNNMRPNKKKKIW